MPGGSAGGSSSGGGARGGSYSGGHYGSGGSSGSGSSANSSGRTQVVDTSGDSYGYVKPRGIIDAVEEIQRFYVFESETHKDIPYNFFSFKQVLDFMWIGFRGAIIESLLFFLIFPLALTVYPAAKVYFMGTPPTIGDYILPFALSYSTIVIMTVYVMSAARYYWGGAVTRKAIHSLFTGRSIAFILKAFLGWWLLTLLYIYSYKDPDIFWDLSESLAWFWNIFLAEEAAINGEILYVFWFQAVVPALKETANDIFLTMLILAAIPFCTLFAYGGYRYKAIRTNRKRFEKYDQHYDLEGLFSFLNPFKPKQSALHLGIGYLLEDSRKEKLIDIYQLNENRKGHTFVAGATRVGKTRLLQNMIIQDIRAGRSVGLIDPKGDWEIWEAMVQEAYRTGREKDLMFISPAYPNHSAPINPLTCFVNEEEPIGHIVAGVPADDEFFYNVALETTTVIVKTLLLQKRYEDKSSGELNFEEVYALADHEGILRCKEIVKPLLELEDEARTIYDLAVKIGNSEKDYFSKISTTLRTTLTQIATGQVGKIMGSAKGNKLIEKLENQERVIFYAQTGALIGVAVSKIMCRVLVSMIQSLAGRLFIKGDALKTPFCLYMDEFSSMVYLGIENLFNKSGGANFFLTAATQSLADVEAAIGVDRARMIFDNTNTKLFMKVNDLRTAEVLAAYGGIKKKYSLILSDRGGITIRETEEDAIKPEEFLRLKSREFFYFGHDEGQYFGKSDPVKPVELKISVGGGNSEPMEELPLETTTDDDDSLKANARKQDNSALKRNESEVGVMI
jgi:hypothetical protein